MNDTRSLHLHYRYCIGILVGILIVISAAAWGADPKLAEKINFAVGVTSVILAVLAIYFTVSFNTLFSNNVTTFLGLNSKIGDSAANLIEATNRLNTQLETIPQGFKGLEATITAHSQEILSRTLSSDRPQADSDPEAALTPFEWTKRELHHWFSGMQFLGMLVTYLAVKSDYTGTIVSVSQLTALNTRFTTDYCAAVLGCLKSFNILGYKAVGDKIVVSAVNPILVDHIDKWLNDVADVIAKSMPDESRGIIETRGKIDELVSDKPNQRDSSSTPSELAR